MKKLLLLCALLAIAPGPLAAQTVILQTATFSDATGNEWTIGGDNHMAYGVPFHVDTPTAVGKVGIGNLRGTGTFYAAIVRIGDAGFPIGYPFNDDEAAAYAVFQAEGHDQRVALKVTLPPGNYMLIVGAGLKYGTDGAGTIATFGQTVVPGTFVLYWIQAGWNHGAQYSGGFNDPLRFVLESATDTERILEHVGTRASQASVDAIASGMGDLATRHDVAYAGQMVSLALDRSVGSLPGPPAIAAAVAAALSGSLESRASQASVNALGQTVAAGNGLLSDMAIERALIDGTPLSILFLPNGLGGHLDDVARIVGRLLTLSEQPHVGGLGNVAQARTSFNHAEDGRRRASQFAPLANGRAAFKEYAQAYQLLTRSKE